MAFDGADFSAFSIVAIPSLKLSAGGLNLDRRFAALSKRPVKNCAVGGVHIKHGDPVSRPAHKPKVGPIEPGVFQ